MSGDEDFQIQRSIGRIEGTQAQILDKLNAIILNQVQHENDDRQNFSSVRRSIAINVKELNTAREVQFDSLEATLQRLQNDSNRAKGAGWVIIGILGALATFLGTAVISVWNGTIKIG